MITLKDIKHLCIVDRDNVISDLDLLNEHLNKLIDFKKVDDVDKAWIFYPPTISATIAALLTPLADITDIWITAYLTLIFWSGAIITLNAFGASMLEMSSL